MNHLEVWEMENASLNGSASWERWVDEAEHIAGHSLDGEQSEDGYSLDEAFEAFCAGKSPREYALAI